MRPTEDKTEIIDTETIDAKAQQKVKISDTRKDFKRKGEELIRPRKEGRKGFKVYKPDNRDLGSTPQESQTVLDTLLLRAFTMSESVFPQHLNPAHNSEFQMPVAEAMYHEAWDQETRNAKQREEMLRNLVQITKNVFRRNSQWSNHWYTNATAAYIVGIDPISPLLLMYRRNKGQWNEFQ